MMPMAAEKAKAEAQAKADAKAKADAQAKADAKAKADAQAKADAAREARESDARRKAEIARAMKMAGSADSDVEKLRQLLAGGDNEKSRRLAHTVKGSAGTLGARTLYERAAALEDAIRNQAESAVIDAHFAAFSDAFRSLSEAIRKRLK